MNEYISIFIFTLIVYFFGRNKIIYWGYFIFLLFFYVMRGNDVGGDTWDYYYQFTRINEGGITDQFHISPVEISFYALNKFVYNVVYTFFPTIKCFWLFVGFIMYWPIFYCADKYFSFSHRIVALFVLQYDYLYSYCFAMQFMSIAILFCGIIQYSQQKNTKKFICWIVFASTFHSSAIVVLALIPFLRRKIKLSVLTIGLLLSYIVGRSGIAGMLFNIFGIKSLYLARYVITDSSNFTINGLIVTFFIAFMINVVKIERTYLYMASFGTMLFNLLAMNGDLARIHWDMSIICVILLASLKLKEKYANIKFLFSLVVLLYGTIVYWSFLLDNQSKILPYEYGTL